MPRLISGIPDEPGGLRPLCWKLLLNYLPPIKSSWLETLKRKRELYNTFIGEGILFVAYLFGEANLDLARNLCLMISVFGDITEDLIVMPGESNADDKERVDVTLHDHPLNLNPDSKWQTYFKDNEVLLQIDKDVRQVLCKYFGSFLSEIKDKKS